jgi:hypothetical protein
LGAPINLADSFRPLRFKLFADSLKLVESCHLRRKLVVAKLHALCTDKYRNDKLMKEALLLLQRVGENRPAMNASFPAGNNGSDVRDGTRATRTFHAASRSVRPAAFRTFTAMKCV